MFSYHDALWLYVGCIPDLLPSLTSAFAEASVGVMDMDLKGYDIYEHDTSWMSAGVCYTHLEADILRQILLRDVSSN